MPLTKKINFKKVSKELTDSRIKKLRMMGNDLVAGIYTRTLQGKDVNLRAFKKEYNKTYKKYRLKHGRTGYPNLTYTGNMLGGMISKKRKTGLRFTFPSVSEKRKAGWNQKTRPFFGLDKKQLALIKKRLSRL